MGLRRRLPRGTAALPRAHADVTDPVVAGPGTSGSPATGSGCRHANCGASGWALSLHRDRRLRRQCPHPRRLRSHYDTLLREFSTQFEEFATTLRSVFGPETTVRPMDDRQHFACLQRSSTPARAAHRRRPGGALRSGADHSGKLLARRRRRAIGWRFLPRRPASRHTRAGPLATAHAARHCHASHRTAVLTTPSRSTSRRPRRATKSIGKKRPPSGSAANTPTNPRIAARRAAQKERKVEA